MKRCVQCSEMLPLEANFCPACGGKAEVVAASPAAVAPTVPDMQALATAPTVSPGSGARPLPSRPPAAAGPPGPSVIGSSPVAATGPTAVAPAATPPAPPPAPAPGGAGKAFRETLWFKKGEVDEFLAKAKSAAGQGPGGPGAAPEAPAEDIRPLEDRYKDDGSVSTADREKFSLRTGATVYQQQSPLAGKKGRAAIPGQRMSDEELIAEFQVGGGKGRWIAIGVGALVVIVLIMLFSGKKPVPGTPSGEKPPAAAEQH